jgi:soluble lytic murein transglycosylase-like protein
MSKTPELLKMAQAAAAQHQLDPAIVSAIVEQESDWDTYAIRFEPQFFAKYVAPLFTSNRITPHEGVTVNTETQGRAFSWGLMQVLGQVARENGFDGKFLSEICDPLVGLDVGCKVFAHKLAMNQGNYRNALLAYNGGAAKSYPDEVMEKARNYLDT